METIQYLNLWKCFIFSPPTRSRPVLLTGMAKNSNENAYLHQSNLKGGEKKVVPVTLTGYKIEKTFKHFQRLKLLMACWKRKEKILFLFKFKLPVTPQSFIFLQEGGK